MFYSHELLTSREGGLATIWLVATLDSKSNSKKVNRKAILDVNVPKTCEKIINPEAPMALRLQSNLLYGVSRVFSRQYGYVLSDAESAQHNLRILLKAVRTSDLDPNAGKARPEQLMIEDDPAFLPDLALPGLDIDLSALDISTDGSTRLSSVLSPHSQRSSLSSHESTHGSMLGLVIPSSNSGGAGELGGFVLPSDNLSSAQRNARFGRMLGEEDEDFNIDPGFQIDAEGNLIEDGPPGDAPAGRVRIGSDLAASDRVRQELLEGLQQGGLEADDMNLDLDIPQFNDGDLLPTGADPFPLLVQRDAATPLGQVRSLSEARREKKDFDLAEGAMRRKAPAQKPLPVDERQELLNADLASWNTNYLANMAEARETRFNHQASMRAKKNAAFWVFGSGIGSVSTGLGATKVHSSLDVFAGKSFLGTLTGLKSNTDRKRDREDEEEESAGNEARRVRSRDGDREQFGRGGLPPVQDDDSMMIQGSEGIEVGRGVQPSLQDLSLPWNAAAASRHGSVTGRHDFPSSVGGFPSSVGGPPALPGVGGILPGSLDRRASRIASASPLLGRGRERYSSLEVPPFDDEFDILGDPPASDDQAVADYQRYGPAAAVSTQIAAQSQWVRATLDREADNFLQFVENEISSARPPADEEEDELAANTNSRPCVSFEQLLPPTQNTNKVAAQAFHHVLALATKGLMIPRQEEAFGSIDLSLPAGT